MAKPRASTIQQRFGFLDGDLKKPEHDEMMFWLDENLEHVVAQIMFLRNTKQLSEAVAHDCPSETLNERHESTVKKRIWEYPVADCKPGGSKYIIGFVDLVAHCDVWDLAEYETQSQYGKWIPDGWKWHNGNMFLCFEVKTVIPSLGELIRQIRMYQEYEKSAFYVVCPDARYGGILHSQGIGFVHYPAGEVWKE